MKVTARTRSLAFAAAAALFTGAGWTAIPVASASPCTQMFGQNAPLLQNRTDSDGDGLSDDDELSVYGTDPYDSDSDGDGKIDGDEVWEGTDPAEWDHESPGEDADYDGLYDLDEIEIYGTDPYDIDSDDDGWADGNEVGQGTDPLVAQEQPVCGEDVLGPCTPE
ncbi:MAG: hypothetical protein ACSLE6_11575 [Mycobacterium sp.]